MINKARRSRFTYCHGLRGCGPQIVSTAQRRSKRLGWSCVELLAVIFLLHSITIAFSMMNFRYGLVAGVLGGFTAAVAGSFLIWQFYRYLDRLRQKELAFLETRYPDIYRVIEVDEHQADLCAQGAQVRTGDYGWEAEPLRKDGKIALHGLSSRWEVVWYASFLPRQVERICIKPRTQYYLPYSWGCRGGEPPPCPYPVQSQPAETLGFPARIIADWVQGYRVVLKK